MAVEELMKLKLERQSSLDMVSGKYENTIDLCLSVEQIKAGLIKQIGCRNFSVLLAIASHLNEQRVAFPNVSTIAEITGLSAPTVINAIQQLEEVTVGGNAIIRKDKIKTSTGHTKSIYHFVGAEIDADDPNIELTAKEVIELFCKYYEETFELPYTVSWARDTSMVKSKLVDKYEPAQLREIVRIAVTKYATFSNSPQYPTPTLGMLCTWLANKAAGVLVQEKEKEQAYQTKVAYAEKVAAIDSAALLDM
ncbi:helix-turn-helix domain-containing protein [Enterococcus sp.]|uniref:helix-turn-helix domain-containing protein n=1 Tax=Enterococcus sp. TaxID=35783 RepID=UPI002FC80974